MNAPRTLVVSLWLVGIVAVAVGGNLPDGYRTHSLNLPDPQPYPIQGVSLFLALVSFHSALLWAIIRPNTYRRSWLRALTALAVTFAPACYFGISLMHAPPYQALHFLWLAAATLALLVTSLVSGIAAARAKNAS